jgi:uncharacterized membrane protein
MDKRKQLIFVTLLILAVVGLVDSFIIFEKVLGNIYAPCVIGEGCETVLYSYYSKFLGIPLSWWGMGFYALATVFLSLILISKKEVLKKIYFLQITTGFLFSLYLFYVQVFELGTLCTYCMISFSDILISIILLLYLKCFRTKEFAIL